MNNDSLYRIKNDDDKKKKQPDEGKCEKLEYESSKKRKICRKQERKTSNDENIDRKRINITIFISCGF